MVQSKLLRVLQERELERVGGTRTISVDVRVIATTNRDLAQSVERKEFRQDLFFRLNVVPIHVPPLRERPTDIPLLAETFMRRYAKKHGCPVGGFSKASLEALQSHAWPGNIRELQNVVERAVILSGEGALIDPDLLGLTVMSSGKIYIPTNPLAQTSQEADPPATQLKTEVPEVYEQASPSAACLLYTSPSPRDRTRSRMPSSA